MAHELPKAYDPGAIEPRWADYWVKEKLFSVKTPESATNPMAEPVFDLLLPPPNVTGSLHIGHMLEHTEIDIVIRWRRMRGFLTLWLPGTDHAGIATQMMVERQLASEASSRQRLAAIVQQRKQLLCQEEDTWKRESQKASHVCLPTQVLVVVAWM